jgi:hypothetical protein
MIISRRGAAALLAAAALSTAAARAVQPDPPYLSGRVIDAETGRPLAGVAVRISGLREFSATTDADGRYRSETLPRGMYYLAASKTGYVPGSPMSPAGIPLRLRVREGGPPSCQRDWMLEPEARILGRVVDANSTPVAGVQVIAARRAQGADGWPVFSVVSTATTADDGRFAIGNLMRGPYVLVYQLQIGSAPRWFFSPGIADPRHATQVEAVSGGSQKPVELRAINVPFARVPILARTTFGAPVANALIELTPWQPFPEMSASQPVTVVTDSAGRAAFENLPVGLHRLLARSPNSNARAVTRGAAALSLPDQVARGIEISMLPTESACVFTRMETDGVAPGDFESPPEITISTRDGALAGERLDARVPLGDMARLTGLAPGSHLLPSAFAQEPLWALARFSPAKPAPRGAIPIDAAAAGCVAAYFRRTSQHISGRIELVDAEWVPEITIIATPLDSDIAPIATTMMNNDGMFRFDGIALGMRYEIIAIPLGMDPSALTTNTRRSVIAAGGDVISIPVSVPIAR